MNYTKEELNLTGIYAIINRVNGKRYIGSAASSFRNRWQGHKRQLTKGNHHSIYLQNSWGKHGDFNFEFRILEIVPKEEWTDNKYLTDIEQMYLDTFQPEYNICPTAGSCLGRKASDETKKKIGAAHKGKIVSEETKEKQRIAHLGQKMSEENKLKVSEFHKGRKRSEETKARIKEVMSNRSPDIIAKTAEANRGRKNSEEVKLRMAKSKRPEGYKILNPQGELVHFYNMVQFCKDNNLSKTTLQEVIKGKYKQHKGWTKA